MDRNQCLLARKGIFAGVGGAGRSASSPPRQIPTAQRRIPQLRRGEAALAGGVMLPEASSTAMRLLTEIVGGASSPEA